MKLDYLFSSAISVAVHGAVAVGLYGAALSGPHIDFSQGNGGVEISVTTPHELGWMSAQSAELKVQDPEHVARMLLPESKPEISLQQKTKPITPPMSARKISQPRPIPVSQRTNGTSSDCESGSCTQLASLGSSGDAGTEGPGLLRAPKPPYPWGARRAGFEGSLVVDVDIAKDGSVRDARLAQSSGREDCDRAALETIRERWRFEPARWNGHAVDWRERVVVVYTLK